MTEFSRADLEAFLKWAEAQLEGWEQGCLREHLSSYRAGQTAPEVVAEAVGRARAPKAFVSYLRAQLPPGSKT